MKVIDLNEGNRDLFCLCLEDWSDDAKESGPRRRQWVDRCQQHHGLRAKLAVDYKGVEGGMIQYGPIEHSHVDGSGLYFIYCIHVHGYKQGRGNFQKHILQIAGKVGPRSQPRDRIIPTLCPKDLAMRAIGRVLVPQRPVSIRLFDFPAICMLSIVTSVKAPPGPPQCTDFACVSSRQSFGTGRVWDRWACSSAAAKRG